MMTPGSPVHVATALLVSRIALAAVVVVTVVVTTGRVLHQPGLTGPVVDPQPVILNSARVRTEPEDLLRSAVWMGGLRSLDTLTTIHTLLPDLIRVRASDLARAWDLDPSLRSIFAVRTDEQGSRAVVRISLSQPLAEPADWPEILNPDQVQRAIARAYPSQLLDEGRGGTVAVDFLIGTDGEVQRTRIRQISGCPALDEAALAVAEVYRFSPAIHEDRPVASWATSPISFRVRRGPESATN